MRKQQIIAYIMAAVILAVLGIGMAIGAFAVSMVL